MDNHLFSLQLPKLAQAVAALVATVPALVWELL